MVMFLLREMNEMANKIDFDDLAEMEAEFDEYLIEKYASEREFDFAPEPIKERSCPECGCPEGYDHMGGMSCKNACRYA